MHYLVSFLRTRILPQFLPTSVALLRVGVCVCRTGVILHALEDRYGGRLSGHVITKETMSYVLRKA